MCTRCIGASVKHDLQQIDLQVDNRPETNRDIRQCGTNAQTICVRNHQELRVSRQVEALWSDARRCIHKQGELIIGEFDLEDTIQLDEIESVELRLTLHTNDAFIIVEHDRTGGVAGFYPVTRQVDTDVADEVSRTTTLEDDLVATLHRVGDFDFVGIDAKRGKGRTQGLLFLLFGLWLTLLRGRVEHWAEHGSADGGAPHHANDDLAIQTRRNEQLTTTRIGLNRGHRATVIDHRHVTAQSLVEVEHDAVEFGGKTIYADHASRGQIHRARKVSAGVGQIGVKHEHQSEVEVVNRQTNGAFVAQCAVYAIVVIRIADPVAAATDRYADKAKHIGDADGNRGDFALGAIGHDDGFSAALGKGHGTGNLQDAGDVAFDVLDLGLNDVLVVAQQNRRSGVAGGHQQAWILVGTKHRLPWPWHAQACQKRREVSSQQGLHRLQGVKHTLQRPKRQARRQRWQLGQIQRGQREVTQQRSRVKTGLGEINVWHRQYKRRLFQTRDQAGVDVDLYLFEADIQHLFHANQASHADIGLQREVFREILLYALDLDAGKTSRRHQGHAEVYILDSQTNEVITARRPYPCVTTQVGCANRHDLYVMIERIYAEVAEDAGFNTHQLLALALGKCH